MAARIISERDRPELRGAPKEYRIVDASGREVYVLADDPDKDDRAKVIKVAEDYFEHRKAS